MRITGITSGIITLAASIGAGIAAFFLVRPENWIDIRTEALTTLSLLAAGILFRLGRGLPQLNIDGLKPEEVDRLVKAYEIITIRLAIVLLVTVVAILNLIIVTPLQLGIGDGAASAIVAFFIVFSLCRAIAVVMGDISSMRVQADLIKKTVQRRNQCESSSTSQADTEPTSFESPPGYGGTPKSLSTPK